MGAKKGEIAKFILMVVGVTGVTLVGLVAPNIFSLFTGRRRSLYTKHSLKQSFGCLKQKKLIKLIRLENSWRLELTEKGQTELSRLEIKQKLANQSRSWDKKWRLLIFDIREKRKHVREQLRCSLADMGFYRLQDSVWVFPYECEEMVTLLRIKYKIHYEAIYVRAERISGDNRLRRHYKLN